MPELWTNRHQRQVAMRAGETRNPIVINGRPKQGLGCGPMTAHGIYLAKGMPLRFPYLRYLPFSLAAQDLQYSHFNHNGKRVGPRYVIDN